MALAFESKKVATLKARNVEDTAYISLAGYNPDETSPENAAVQANKILGLGGKAITADDKMILTVAKGVVTNG